MIHKLVCPSIWAWVIWNFSILITLMCNMCFFIHSNVCPDWTRLQPLHRDSFFFGLNQIESHCHRECSVELVSFSIKKFIDVFCRTLILPTKNVYFSISNWQLAIGLEIISGRQFHYISIFRLNNFIAPIFNKHSKIERFTLSK